MTTKWRVLVLFVIASLLGATACGSSTPKTTTPTSAPNANPTTIRLYASVDAKALSMELVSGFEADNKDLKVEASFVPASELLAAVRDHKADVVLSTTQTVHSVTAAVQVKSDPVVVGWNVLVIVVAKGNPKKIVGARVFGVSPKLTTVLVKPDSLIGQQSAKVLKNLGITPAPDLTAATPNEAIDDVIAGKADATIVGRTFSAPRKDKIGVVEIYRKNVGTQFQAVAVETTPNPMKFLNYFKTLSAKTRLLKLGYTPSRAS